jgi:hypothetical protein
VRAQCARAGTLVRARPSLGPLLRGTGGDLLGLAEIKKVMALPPPPATNIGKAPKPAAISRMWRRKPFCLEVSVCIRIFSRSVLGVTFLGTIEDSLLCGDR